MAERAIVRFDNQTDADRALIEPAGRQGGRPTDSAGAAAIPGIARSSLPDRKVGGSAMDATMRRGNATGNS